MSHNQSLILYKSSCYRLAPSSAQIPITNPAPADLWSTYELLQVLTWCSEELRGVYDMDTHYLPHPRFQ